MAKSALESPTHTNVKVAKLALQELQGLFHLAPLAVQALQQSRVVSAGKLNEMPPLLLRIPRRA